MTFPRPTLIHANRGSGIQALITLQGADGNPIDLFADPVLFSVVDVSPELGTPTIAAPDPLVNGQVIVTIPWNDARQNGVGYQFRVRYFFEDHDVVYTTPLFGVIYQ